jgi:DNA mismatch repair ATPase MutS
MYTKGTFSDTNKDSYEPNYIMALKKEGDYFGVCFFDLSTSKCNLGQFKDDTSQSALRTIMT